MQLGSGPFLGQTQPGNSPRRCTPSPTHTPTKDSSRPECFFLFYSQALLDMYTIKREIGRLDNVRVGMIGDLGESPFVTR